MVDLATRDKEHTTLAMLLPFILAARKEGAPRISEEETEKIKELRRSNVANDNMRLETVERLAMRRKEEREPVATPTSRTTGIYLVASVRLNVQGSEVQIAPMYFYAVLPNEYISNLTVIQLIAQESGAIGYASRQFATNDNDKALEKAA
jgi:hypothetical protein